MPRSPSKQGSVTNECIVNRFDNNGMIFSIMWAYPLSLLARHSSASMIRDMGLVYQW